MTSNTEPSNVYMHYSIIQFDLNQIVSQSHFSEHLFTCLSVTTSIFSRWCPKAAATSVFSQGSLTLSPIPRRIRNPAPRSRTPASHHSPHETLKDSVKLERLDGNSETKKESTCRRRNIEGAFEDANHVSLEPFLKYSRRGNEKKIVLGPACDRIQGPIFGSSWTKVAENGPQQGWAKKSLLRLLSKGEKQDPALGDPLEPFDLCNQLGRSYRKLWLLHCDVKFEKLIFGHLKADHSRMFGRKDACHLQKLLLYWCFLYYLILSLPHCFHLTIQVSQHLSMPPFWICDDLKKFQRERAAGSGSRLLTPDWYLEKYGPTFEGKGHLKGKPNTPSHKSSTGRGRTGVRANAAAPVVTHSAPLPTPSSAPAAHSLPGFTVEQWTALSAAFGSLSPSSNQLNGDHRTMHEDVAVAPQLVSTPTSTSRPVETPPSSSEPCPTAQDVLPVATSSMDGEGVGEAPVGSENDDLDLGLK
ncbi:Uncharacterized protein Fot_09334 [Forsythia ovata]|uniref:Uncharacterized protein n=1 Tax=Forsythia ovata TaxID=205694 RepID=A0ABD1WDR2_9LAMI